MNRWFLPHTPDVLGLLEKQAQVTIEGMEAFLAWSNGDPALAQALGDAEHRADHVRRDLQRRLKEAFYTPLDPEDIYELSERLDKVLNSAKNAVREAEVMKLVPNSLLAEMAADLAQGVRHLQAAFESIASEPEKATREADAAIKSDRRVEHCYRQAMSSQLEVREVKEVIAWREMYRRYARLGEAIVSVAERVWYATIKQS
jgi:uncharacterized protein Yka (UPF0111/DUF47 family)